MYSFGPVDSKGIVYGFSAQDWAFLGQAKSISAAPHHGVTILRQPDITKIDGGRRRTRKSRVSFLLMKR